MSLFGRRSRGSEAEKLRKNLCDFENFVGKLIFEIENGEYLITDGEKTENTSATGQRRENRRNK